MVIPDHPSNGGIGNAGIFYMDDDPNIGPMRVLFPANADSGLFEQRFIFRNRMRPMAPSSVDGAWFYCAITYKDIFGYDRHTFFYVSPFAAGIVYPENHKYNRWD